MYADPLFSGNNWTTINKNLRGWFSSLTAFNFMLTLEKIRVLPRTSGDLR